MADVIQTTQIKDLPDATSLATGDRIPLQKANGATSDIDYSTFVSQAVNFPVSSNMGNKSVVAGLNELYADRLSVVDDGVITDELNIYYNKEQVNSLISGVQSAYQSADNNLQNQINTLNSNLTTLNNSPRVNTIRVINGDMDEIDVAGVYTCRDCSHAPTNSSWHSLEVVPHGGDKDGNLLYACQIARPLTSAESYVRYREGTEAWSSWVQQPTRSEITTLNNRQSSVVTSDYMTIANWSTVRKCGNIKFLYFGGQVTEARSGYTAIANIPSEFRPSSDVNFYTTYKGDGTRGQCQLLSNGDIRVQSNVAIGDVIGFSVSYS